MTYSKMSLTGCFLINRSNIPYYIQQTFPWTYSFFSHVMKFQLTLAASYEKYDLINFFLYLMWIYNFIKISNHNTIFNSITLMKWKLLSRSYDRCWSCMIWKVPIQWIKHLQQLRLQWINASKICRDGYQNLIMPVCS